MERTSLYGWMCYQSFLASEQSSPPACMTAVACNENPLLSFPQSGTGGGVCRASLSFKEL